MGFSYRIFLWYLVEIDRRIGGWHGDWLLMRYGPSELVDPVVLQVWQHSKACVTYPA